MRKVVLLAVLALSLGTGCAKKTAMVPASVEIEKPISYAAPLVALIEVTKTFQEVGCPDGYSMENLYDGGYVESAPASNGFALQEQKINIYIVCVDKKFLEKMRKEKKNENSNISILLPSPNSGR